MISAMTSANSSAVNVSGGLTSIDSGWPGVALNVGELAMRLDGSVWRLMDVASYRWERISTPEQEQAYMKQISDRLQAVEWMWRDARNIGYEVSVELYAPDANRYGKHAAEAK